MMNTDTPGVLAEVRSVGSASTVEVFHPLLGGEPADGQVGVIINDVFFPALLEVPSATAPVALVEMPVQEPPYSTGLCMPVEPPVVRNELGRCGYAYVPQGEGGRTAQIFYCLDTPLENAPAFNAADKDNPAYVRNLGITSIYSVSHEEYDLGSLDPKVGVGYVYVASDSDYLTAQPQPQLQHAPQVGVIWDGQSFIPSTTYLYVRAFRYGRFLSSVRRVQIVRKIGKVVVEYNADTAQIAVSVPYTSGTTIALHRNGSLISSNMLNPGTLTQDGNYTVRASKSDRLDSDEFGFSIVLKTPETEEAETFTPSFTRSFWSQIPEEMISGRKQEVAVLLSRPKPDYYVSPDGTGDGLTPETPGSWEYVLGYSSNTNAAAQYYVPGIAAAGAVVWCATGEYSTSYPALAVPQNVRVVGGFDAEFTEVIGRSIAGCTIRNNINTRIENLAAFAPGRLEAINNANYHAGAWVNCHVSFTGGGYYSHGEGVLPVLDRIIVGSLLRGCSIDCTCASGYIGGSGLVIIGCQITISSILPPVMINATSLLSATIAADRIIDSTVNVTNAESCIIGNRGYLYDSYQMLTDYSRPCITSTINVTITGHPYQNGKDGADGELVTQTYEWYDEWAEEWFSWTETWPTDGQPGSDGRDVSVSLCIMAVDCQISVNMPNAGHGGKGGDGAYYADWQSWSLRGSGGLGGNIRFSPPVHMRGSSLSVSIGNAGNGGAAGVVGEIGGWYNPTYNGARGLVEVETLYWSTASGVRWYLYGLSAWENCEISGNVGDNGEHGDTPNVEINGTTGEPPAHYWRRNSNVGRGGSTAGVGGGGWYSGNGGSGSEQFPNGGHGGLGVPVPGLETPGQGGQGYGDGEDGKPGVYVGDYWEYYPGSDYYQ